MTAPYDKVLVHACSADSITKVVLVHVHIAESTQPRKARADNVTRPFPFLWEGRGGGERL